MSEKILTTKLIKSYELAHSIFERQLRELRSIESILSVGGMAVAIFSVINIFLCMPWDYFAYAVLVSSGPWACLAIHHKRQTVIATQNLNKLRNELKSINYSVCYENQSTYYVKLIITEHAAMADQINEIPVMINPKKGYGYIIDIKKYIEVFQLG